MSLKQLFDNLSEQLSTDNKILTLKAENIGDENIKAFLTEFYQNENGNALMVVHNAQKPILDEKGILISGRSSYLNMPDLPTHLLFTQDATQKMQIIVILEIVRHEQENWKFSQAFPDLPSTFHGGTKFTDPQKSLCDYFDYMQAHLILTNQASPIIRAFAADKKLADKYDIHPDAYLQKGLNFISLAKPVDFCVFEYLNPSGRPLTLYGTIHLKSNEDQKSFISLKASLEPVINIRQLTLNNPFFELTSPIRRDEATLGFQAKACYKGWFRSNQKDIELSSDLVLGFYLLLYKAPKNLLSVSDLDALLTACELKDDKINEILIYANESDVVVKEFVISHALREGEDKRYKYFFIELQDPNSYKLINNFYLEKVKISIYFREPYSDSKKLTVSLEGSLKEGINEHANELPKVVLDCMHSLETATIDQIDLKNSEGNSALHEAIRASNYKIFECLMGVAADWDLQNNAGNTPLQEAILANNTEIIDKLLEYELYINLENKEGKTARQLAAEAGNTDLADRIKNYKYKPSK